MPANNLLVIVHPGSAVGSADFNIGKTEARAAREDLALELQGWNGGVVVIDGELSDELDRVPSLRDAINAAVQRAAESGYVSERLYGDDPDQVVRIAELVQKWGPPARDWHFTVSGAWYHPEDGSGCVGSVIDELRRLGCVAEVSDSAVTMTNPFNDTDEDFVSEKGSDLEEASPPGRSPRP